MPIGPGIHGDEALKILISPSHSERKGVAK